MLIYIRFAVPAQFTPLCIFLASCVVYECSCIILFSTGRRKRKKKRKKKKRRMGRWNPGNVVSVPSCARCPRKNSSTKKIERGDCLHKSLRAAAAPHLSFLVRSQMGRAGLGSPCKNAASRVVSVCCDVGCWAVLLRRRSGDTSMGITASLPCSASQESRVTRATGNARETRRKQAGRQLLLASGDAHCAEKIKEKEHEPAWALLS